MSIFPQKNNLWVLLAGVLVISVLAGGIGGFFGGRYLLKNKNVSDSKNSQDKKVVEKVTEQSAVIDAARENSPAVVSIVITKDLPVIEERDSFGAPFGDRFFREFFGFETPKQYEQKGTQEKEVGGGSGFIISSDGYIVTNKHVVSDTEAEYTVLTNDQEKHKAKVLARDSVMDVAVLKIEGKDFPSVEFGDSSDLKVGQTVIAIGNALGEFRNTVSTGVISGLSRSVVASGEMGQTERLSGVIQTDASINLGNSGGPLLNIDGQVIGINTARASGAENIGFAIPVNEIKETVEDVREHGRIVRPWLGVRYVLLNKQIAEANNLSVEKGALVVRGRSRTDLAVIPGSPADKAGLRENDIIISVEDNQISKENPLVDVINDYNPGDKIEMTILRQGEEEKVEVELDERDA